ncbi:MAG: glutamine--fructose-6-phosphate transaminase (isomerizing) [Candidatus Spechtbacteria bacterium]|nr:glutamine--fructose-6-phosphate transaminase (isomerizing) [Candidatus Spechtbacteria bacterium]
MCGIVGYIGKNNDPRLGLEALKRLEYRGYDSAGMAVYDAKKKRIVSLRAVGRISELEKKFYEHPFEGMPFIFHTRWATHGEPSVKNAHPHFDCTKTISVAHNGIIENYQTLKEHLQKEGHVFHSDTDTEVLAHLIESLYKNSLEKAVHKALGMVRGTYGLAVLSSREPDKIIAARLSSPLLIGVGKGEHIIASDASAVLAHTKDVVYMQDGDIAVITPDSFSITTKNYEARNPAVEQLEWNLEAAQKGGYPHFMLKEIFEQPDAIENSLRGRILAQDGKAKLGGLEVVKEKLRDIEKVHIIACGTASYAASVGEYMLEEYAGIPTEVDFASEFRYRKPLLNSRTAVLAVSQSGETADTLAALREAREKGAMTLGIVNVVGSTIARETDAGVYNHAGPEIGVASTKAFTSQLAVLALLTLFLGRQRGMSVVIGKRIANELALIPGHMREILKQDAAIKKIAAKYRNAQNALYIGRKYNFPIALEGALKLKEISYIHAEGYASGEMKHGPIALIDDKFPTIAIAPEDSVYEKMLSNIQEIKARKGKIIAVTTMGNTKISALADDVIYIPKTLEMLTPLLSVLPLQLLAYHIGVLNGRDVDKPRNLAKSVTVE